MRARASPLHERGSAWAATGSTLTGVEAQLSVEPPDRTVHEVQSVRTKHADRLVHSLEVGVRGLFPTGELLRQGIGVDQASSAGGRIQCDKDTDSRWVAMADGSSSNRSGTNRSPRASPERNSPEATAHADSTA